MKLIREFDDFDWIRDTTPNFDEKNTPRVGDVLVCLPGYHNSPSDPYHNELEDPNCAGAGYAEGRIIVVKEVDIWSEGPEGKRLVVWPNEEESEMYWDYDDGEVCFECGIYGFALTYYTETLNESEVDDFDWVSDVTPTFYDFWENNLLEEGDILTLRGETSDIAGRPVFLDGAKCQIKKLKPHFLATKVMFDPETQRKIGVYNVTKLVDAEAELIVLDHQRGGSLEEAPSEPQLYESEVDDFDWANNRLINPWELGYDLVFFDEVPTRKDVEELIEMALTSRNLNRHSKKAWLETDTRNAIIRKIINRANLSNRGVYLIYYENMDRLLWGSGPIKEEHNKINKINYSNLIETNLTESDDPFQWIRDIQPPSFKDAVIGQTYDITTTRNLLDAIRECNDNEEIYLSKRAEVRDKDNLPYRDVFCGHEREDIVPALLLEFLNEEGWNITQFWVTEDMVQLH